MIERNKKDIPEEEKPSFATNDSDAEELYLGRLRYQDEIDDVKFIDIWKDYPLYGKIDERGNASFISETNLKQIESEDTLFLADFVADAYTDFIGDMRKAKALNLIPEDSIMGEIEPQRAWESVNTEHHYFMQGIYNAFVTDFLQIDGRYEKVESFDDFMRFMVFFLKDRKELLSFTRTSFILSTYCSPLTSGLMVDLDDAISHGNDLQKQTLWLTDKSFILYRNLARKRGLRIDKNAPWRLIADVTTPEMQKYMVSYGIEKKIGTLSDLFPIYYYSSHLLDIDILRRYMVQMYNSFVTAYPTIKKMNIKLNGDSQFKTIKRESLDDEETFIEKYDDLYWIEKYIVIRSIESGKEWGKQQLGIIEKKARDLYFVLDFDACMDYINETFRIQI